MDLFKSKKFQMALVGIIVAVVGHMIPEIDQAALTEVAAVIVAYLISQGLADFGKEGKENLLETVRTQAKAEAEAEWEGIS